MQQRTVVTNGKRYLVNVPSWEDGVGAGFAVGQLVMKDYSTGFWYIITVSGSMGSVTTQVTTNLSASFGSSSYFDMNLPYQLLSSTDGNTYQLYLTGGTITVSQSMWATGSYIRNWQNAIIDTAKPNLLLQSVSDGNYYQAYLSSSGGTTSLVFSPTMVSQSWVNPIF